MGPEIAQTPPPPPPPAPVPPRRLSRSSRERMWAGVAGGMGEYFDLDPSLVRLIWVAAAVVSHGLAVPLYILAWIILPRDDRPTEPARWRDWSQEFHAETQRLAQEARRVADDIQGTPTTTPEPPTAEPATPASDKGQPAAAPKPDPQPAPAPNFTQPWGPTTDPAPAPNWGPTTEPAPSPAWSASAEPASTWSTPTEIEQPRGHGGQPRGVGIALVGLGGLLLAVNAGWFSWFSWGTMWPVIFIGLGVVLLARQFDWWGR